MATIAIGDIHGNLAALDDLLQQVTRVVSADDTVVFLGDYIDRGLQSRQCIDAILAFRQASIADVICLSGNHEEWFLQTRDDYRKHSWLLAMDALETIASYSPAAAQLVLDAAQEQRGELYAGQRPLPYEAFFAAVPPAHLEFFESLRSHYHGPHGFCSHGGVDPRVTVLAEQHRHALLWGAHGFPERYEGDDIVVYGHWNNAELDDDGWPAPAITGRTIGIDTIAHGVLTAIRLPDNRILQSARYA